MISMCTERQTNRTTNGANTLSPPFVHYVHLAETTNVKYLYLNLDWKEKRLGLGGSGVCRRKNV